MTNNVVTVLNAMASAEISEAVKRVHQDGTVKLSTGIVFRIKPVPPFLVRDAQARLREPTPPMVYIDDKDTDEENPNDPGYLRALQEYQQNLGELSNAIMLTRGTELVSVPDGIDSPDDTDWAEDVRDLAGLDVPSVGRRRYYCWLKYVALTTVDDFTLLLSAIQEAAGITLEQDVADAAKSFRDNEAGDTASGVRAEAEAGFGDISVVPPPLAGA